MRLFEAQNNYIYEQYVEIEKTLPEHICQDIIKKIERKIKKKEIDLVNHNGLGTESELDGAGKYYHHIVKGKEVKKWFPELVVLYHCLLPRVAQITCARAVLSPYPDSNINIKIYPPGGGTIGWHFDTNTITALLYLTNNTEAPLEMEIRKSHPSQGTWTEKKDYYAKEGSLFLMQGRKVWHQSKPTEKESKMVVVLNYYTEDDTWRPTNFDEFVYEGKNNQK